MISNITVNKMEPVGLKLSHKRIRASADQLNELRSLSTYEGEAEEKKQHNLEGNGRSLPYLKLP